MKIDAHIPTAAGWRDGSCLALLIILACLPAMAILRLVLEPLFWIGLAAGVALYHFCIA